MTTDGSDQPDAIRDLTAAIAGLSEREARLTAELLEGLEFAQRDGGLRRPAAIWRALARLLRDETERQGAALEHLEGDATA